MHHRSSSPQRHHLIVEVPHLRSTVVRALVIALETAIIPTVLLMLLLHYVGLVAALSAVLGWCAVVLATRRALGKELPRTLLLCTGMLASKAAFALVTSSAVVYVIQPAVGSVLMFLLFVGSAALGKPITARLAKDFVHLPAELFANKAVRRVFVNVALLWGASRLIDAAMTVGFLHWSVEAGLFSRGVLSGLLTALTIAVCAGHGWRALQRLPGVTLRWAARPAAV
ncbi:hypothetical protein [Prauserella cavernicola]|uniref:Intracellular septation protein A n=1 Tax=Prauserella cavernicola TaxID=2800127 RepID=A0A934V7Z7_9PSEU|nr:hypothetical protein [Prauserella cavernicola]MBK1788199.1 hypothetical protein [Prauserella cavernicola]